MQGHMPGRVNSLALVEAIRMFDYKLSPPSARPYAKLGDKPGLG